VSKPRCSEASTYITPIYSGHAKHAFTQYFQNHPTLESLDRKGKRKENFNIYKIIKLENEYERN
jgi:hypothetical protein